MKTSSFIFRPAFILAAALLLTLSVGCQCAKPPPAHDGKEAIDNNGPHHNGEPNAVGTNGPHHGG